MDEVLQATGLDESAHTIGRKSARSGRVEIITRGERRRSWTLEQKREIVLESLGSELTPSEVARKHAISSGQLYTDGGRLVADILRARILAIACGYEDGARGLRCHFGREGLRS